MTEAVQIAYLFDPNQQQLVKTECSLNLFTTVTLCGILICLNEAFLWFPTEGFKNAMAINSELLVFLAVILTVLQSLRLKGFSMLLLSSNLLALTYPFQI